MQIPDGDIPSVTLNNDVIVDKRQNVARQVSAAKRLRSLMVKGGTENRLVLANGLSKPSCRVVIVDDHDDFNLFRA